MAETFEIKVPISFKSVGNSDNSGGGKKSEKTDDKLEDLTKAIVSGLSIEKILADAFSGVYDLLQPIVRLLSALLIVVFLPLLPVIIKISTFLADFIKRMAEAGGGLQGLLKTIFSKETFAGLIKLIGSILLDLFKFVTSLVTETVITFAKGFVEIISYVFKIISEGVVIIWNKIISPALKMLGEGVMLIWNKIILPGWLFFVNIGKFIWETIIYPGFSALLKIGEMIWNIIKAPFEYVANKIMSFFGKGGSKKSGQDFILRPNGQFIETSPSDTIIAMKDPSKLSNSYGGNNITVNIDSPSFKSREDMQELVRLISHELNSRIKRRHS